MKTIYLHIGCEKTGTTSIQHFLASNRQALKAQGIAYPYLGLNTTAHLNLAASINSVQNKSQGVDYYPNKNVSVEKEWAQLKHFYNETDCQTIILSAEHFSSRLKKSGIHMLKTQLDQLGDNLKVKVLVYIRRQDWFIESSYSTAVKAGSTSVFEDFFNANLLATNRYDFDLLLTQWSNVFSPNNIIVADYDEVVATQSLLEHFCNVVEVDKHRLKPLDKIENKAWPPKMLEFARLSNVSQLKEQLGPQRLAFFSYINNMILKEKSEKSCLMTPQQRQQVLNKYQESNEIVQEKYFNSHNLFAKAKNANNYVCADNISCTRQFITNLLINTYLEGIDH
jgi:hypothetical protein